MAELADALDSGSNFRKEVEVQILLPAPNKNKTNPRENLEFVLFYTRDYLGLSVKFRISRISKDKGRDIFSPFIYATDFLSISSYTPEFSISSEFYFDITVS